MSAKGGRKASGLRLSRFDDMEPYEPAGHLGVVNRLLVGLGEGNVTAVSVWHGRVEPDGGAEPHVHESSLQVYVGISGKLVVSAGAGVDEKILGPGDAVVIPTGVAHGLKNRGGTVATLVVISSPALR